MTDCHNNRIQLFHSGEKNGTTVVDEKATKPFLLKRSTGIILDADRNLFIVGKEVELFVQSLTGLWCIAVCSNTPSSEPNELSEARRLSFGSHRHIFIKDHDNHRI